MIISSKLLVSQRFGDRQLAQNNSVNFVDLLEINTPQSHSGIITARL